MSELVDPHAIAIYPIRKRHHNTGGSMADRLDRRRKAVFQNYWNCNDTDVRLGRSLLDLILRGRSVT